MPGAKCTRVLLCPVIHKNRMTGAALGPPPRMKRRRLSWRKVGLVLLVPAALIVLLVRAGGKETVPAAPAAKAPRAAMSCSEYPYKHYSPKLNAKLPAYKQSSAKAGIKPLKDEAALSRALAAGSVNLIRIESDERIWVAPMDHGSPYLTANAAASLHAIAKDFKARIADTDLADARIRVTSLLRTKEDQRKLGRGNVNATRDELAPHTHGTSMDLSYMKFVDQQGGMLDLQACQQVYLAETLAEVIAEHAARDKRIHATKEKQQACYHISVCR